VDPYRSSTSLLLNMQGANNSTTIIDESKNAFAITANGNAKLSTTRARYGVSSLLLDGTSGAYLSTGTSSEFALTADWTVELSAYVNTTSAANYTMLHINAGGNNGIHLYYFNTQLRVDNGLAADYDSAAGVMPSSTWVDIALCKVGTSLAILKNGAVLTIRTAQSYGTPDRVQVGRFSTGGSTNNANANIGNVRITKGVSRLVYPVLTAAFPVR
jgi:hypothetical protein